MLDEDDKAKLLEAINTNLALCVRICLKLSIIIFINA